MTEPIKPRPMPGLARLAPAAPARILPSPDETDFDEGQNIPSPLRSAFGRRWRLVLLMWILVGGGLSAIVWTRFENDFEAMGIVRVSPSIPRILFRDEDSGIVPLYGSFLTTQMQLITSHPVLARALEVPEVRNLPWVNGSSDPAAALAKRLKVESPADTELIQISMEGRDPKELAPVINAVIKAYMEKVVLEDQREELSKLEYLYQKRDALETELKSRHDELYSMANELGAYSLGNQQDTVFTGTQATRNELRKAQVARATAEARLQSLKQQGISPPSDVDVERLRQEQLAGDQGLAALERSKADTERMLVNLTRQLGPNHREVKILNTQLQDLGRMIQQRKDDISKFALAAAQFKQKEAHETELRKAEQAYEDTLQAEVAFDGVVKKDLEAMAKMGRGAIKLQDLHEKTEQDKQLHEAILERIQHIEVEKQRPARVTVASFASEPVAPSKDKRPKLTMLAVGGSLFLAMLTALMVDLRDTSVRCEEDVRRATGLAIVGTRTLAALPGSTDEAVVASVTEEIRSIRGCVLFAQEANDCRTILITSPNPQEGKTRTASDLAVALAEGGRRVLLIDADNRKRDLTVQFDGDSRPGLSDVLAESHSISDVICATSTSGLTFLPAGTLCDTFSELLVSPGRFERLQKAFDDYDLVVIDSPPVLLSNEPGIWARHLDAVLMVLRANSSSREDAVAAKERLSRMGARIIGVVLNGVDHHSTHYGRYGYAYSRGCA